MPRLPRAASAVPPGVPGEVVARAGHGAPGRAAPRRPLTPASCLSWPSRPRPETPAPREPRPPPAARFLPAAAPPPAGPSGRPLSRSPGAPGPAQPGPARPLPRPAPTLSPSSGYCYPGALWAHGPLFICHSTSARAWSDGNAPPALLSARYVAEPGGLARLSRPRLGSRRRRRGSPEDGELLAGRCARAGLKRGSGGAPARPHSSSTSKAARAPARRSAARPPLPRGRCPERGGAGRGGEDAAGTAAAADACGGPGASASRREGEAGPAGAQRGAAQRRGRGRGRGRDVGGAAASARDAARGRVRAEAPGGGGARHVVQ